MVQHTAKLAIADQ